MLVVRIEYLPDRLDFEKAQASRNEKGSTLGSIGPFFMRRPPAPNALAEWTRPQKQRSNRKKAQKVLEIRKKAVSLQHENTTVDSSKG